MSITVDWTAVGGLAVLAAAIAWLVRLQSRQQAHEDLCAERYKAIEHTHAQLVKVSDERHAENRDRLDGIDQRVGDVDEKIDLVLAKLR